MALEGRKTLTREELKKALEVFTERLDSVLEEKGYHAFVSRHEALGLINEEMHELTEAVQAGGDLTEVREELLDVPVLCVFAVACIDAGTMDW